MYAIFTYMNGWFDVDLYGKCIGKYNSAMDGMAFASILILQTTKKWHQFLWSRWIFTFQNLYV